MSFFDLLAWELVDIFWFWFAALVTWVAAMILAQKSIIRSGSKFTEFVIVFLPPSLLFILDVVNVTILLQYGGDFSPRFDLQLARYGYGLIFQWFPVMMMMVLFLLYARQHDLSSTTLVAMTSIQALILLLVTSYPATLTFLEAFNKFTLDVIVHITTWSLVFLIASFLIVHSKFLRKLSEIEEVDASLKFFVHGTVAFLPSFLMMMWATLENILNALGIGLAWLLPGMFIYPLLIAAVLAVIVFTILRAYSMVDEQNILETLLEAGRERTRRSSRANNEQNLPQRDHTPRRADQREIQVRRKRAAGITKTYVVGLIILLSMGWGLEYLSFDLAFSLLLLLGFGGVALIYFFVMLTPSTSHSLPIGRPRIKITPKLMGMLIIATITGLSLVIVPAVEKIQELEQGNDALDYVAIGKKSLDEYPVILDYFRFVDRDLFLDLVESLKLPEPPKSFRVEVLEEHAAIGKIGNKPAWIVPLRYVSALFNPDTNYIAGYIAMDLDNPIPENIRIKYSEMSVGPGLTGLRDLSRVVIEIAPDAMMSSTYYLIDPWTDGNPAWVVLLDRYSSWGVRIPDSVLVVHADRTWERLSLKKALDKGIPGVVSENAMSSMVHAATRYLRGTQVDPSARGFLWLPPSPDVQEDIEGLPFYHRPHHFLLNDRYLGRDFYMQVRTGSKESVVSWLRINDTIYSYDLRGYSKGGLVGVNTPDVVLGDLTSIAETANVGNINVRYPKLYRVTFGNATLLLWVSLLIQVQSGQDRFAGAVFVDAANSRIKGVVTARLGESPETFKERLENAINQSYVGFLTGNDTIGGETAVGIINNGTVVRKNWVLLQPDNQYAIVLYIQNKTDLVFVLVTEDSVATKEDFYVASILEEGDHVNIEARYDKDHQAWLAYKVELMST